MQTATERIGDIVGKVIEITMKTAGTMAFLFMLAILLVQFFEG